MAFDAPNREEPAGVGALAGSRAYIPTNMALYEIDVEKGKRVRRVPWARPEMEAGNVTVAGGFLITTTRERLNCFYDKDLLEKRITRAAEEHPEDPQAALRAARMCLRNEKLRDALRFFEKAKKLSLPTSPMAREAEHGLYLATMKLAETAWEKGEQGGAAVLYRSALGYAPGKREKIKAILQILEYHKRAGPDDAIEGIYRELIRDFSGFSYSFPAETSPVPADLWARFQLARHYYAKQRPAAAVLEYQTVIANFADVPFQIGPSRGPAGALAEEAIDTLITVAGRGVYKVFDEKAAALFEKGTKTRDVEVLGEILVRFPNALVFGDTLLTLGRIHMEAGNHEDAAGALKHFLRKYPRGDKTAQALFLLFRALVKQKRHLDARRVLVRLKKSFPFAELEGVKEGPKKAGAWATAKLKEKTFRLMQGATLREDVKYKDGATQWEARFHAKPFLLPMSGTRPFEIFPFVVVRVGKEIRALSVKDGEVVWTAPVQRDPRRVFFAGKALVVVESQQILGLSPESGKRLWARTFPNHGLVMAATVREDVLAATVRVYAGKRRDFSLVVMNADTGEDLFEPRRLGSWGGKSLPTVGAELVVGYVRESRPPMIFVFDLVNGRELMAHKVRDSRDLLQCTPKLFEEERRLVYCTLDAVVALDLSGRRAWSSPVGMIDRDSLVRYGGTVILSRRDPMKGHEIMAFRVEDGEILWRKHSDLLNIWHRDVIGASLFVMGMTGREVKLLRMRIDTGEAELSALINDRPGFPPTMRLGHRFGVAKIVWRSRQRSPLESAFRILDQDSGKIVHVLPLEEGTLAEDFIVIDGRLVYAQRDKIIAWGR
ncbi:MAG: outer membrane protein assembly factor BamB family protein [Planctomycetota bacterium]|jgi:tetratricopeptide (TPR) repeat protein